MGTPTTGSLSLNSHPREHQLRSEPWCCVEVRSGQRLCLARVTSSERLLLWVSPGENCLERSTFLGTAWACWYLHRAVWLQSPPCSSTAFGVDFIDSFQALSLYL